MNNDTVIKEIQKAIDEIRQNGEHHAEFVRSNGELVIAGLEMALNILNSINPEPCGDTISRRAAIEACHENYDSILDFKSDGKTIACSFEDILEALPDVTDTNVGDMISRQAAIEAIFKLYEYLRMIDPTEATDGVRQGVFLAGLKIEQLPCVQPERLNDDDFETIRIHINAYKEKLCNQQRWKEAEKYQRIIDRFMTFASAQPEQNPCTVCQEFDCTGCKFRRT